MTALPPDPAGKNPADLVGDVLTGFARLVKGELALARAEAADSLRDAAKALGMVAVAAILIITALNVLSGAAVAGLVHLGIAPAWAALLVGAVLLVLAVGLVQYARHLLNAANLSPRRSFQNLRRDAEIFKSMVAPGAAANIRS